MSILKIKSKIEQFLKSKGYTIVLKFPEWFTLRPDVYCKKKDVSDVVDLGETLRARAEIGEQPRPRGPLAGRGGSDLDRLLDEGVPGLAAGALPQPLGAGEPAALATVDRLESHILPQARKS